MNRIKFNLFWLMVLCLQLFVGCSAFTTDPIGGPDKQSVGTWTGGGIGAGTGAVIGAETSATTAGAWAGLGFGALFGMISGLGLDLLEEDQLRRQAELQRMREIAWTQEVLAEHYARRMELHPNRDIFPADWFFVGDSASLRPGAHLLLEAIAEMTRRRMPWSRVVVAAYNTASDPDSKYAAYITKKRAEAIALCFVDNGIEPRRVLTQAVTLPEPILVDPDDAAGRYRQAVEVIPIDY